MAVVTMRQLLESGVHFGHQTRRWNPKMKRFIMTERNGIYIIDLQQSLTYINSAYDFVKQTVAHGGTILFVGTKKQAQDAIEEEAQRCKAFYVNHRWLGGSLTNFATIRKSIERLKWLETIIDNGTIENYPKKEQISMKRHKIKLDRSLTQSILTNVQAQKVVQGTVLIASGLSAEIIAEGVETEEEAQLMRLSGCHQLQGYHFGKPQAASALCTMVPQDESQRLRTSA